MLVAFPAAYLFGSACVDLFARATGRRRWFRTASHLNALGIASALAAAIPGLIDYMFVVPPKSSAKNRATDHMFANLSALAMFALARVGRREAPALAPHQHARPGRGGLDAVGKQVHVVARCAREPQLRPRRLPVGRRDHDEALRRARDPRHERPLDLPRHAKEQRPRLRHALRAPRRPLPHPRRPHHRPRERHQDERTDR